MFRPAPLPQFGGYHRSPCPPATRPHSSGTSSTQGVAQLANLLTTRLTDTRNHTISQPSRLPPQPLLYKLSQKNTFPILFLQRFSMHEREDQKKQKKWLEIVELLRWDSNP